MRRILLATATAVALLTPMAATATVRITEFMSRGTGGANSEFIEITNLGAATVDTTGWSFNDNNPNNPVAFGSTIGILAAGESAILTELSAANFRARWGLSNLVKVLSIGGNSNLSSDGDTINIYNSTTQIAANLVDSIVYGNNQTAAGRSTNRPFGLGTTAVAFSSFVQSSTGDIYGSRESNGVPFAALDIGNPGTFAAVPEPTTWGLMLIGFGVMGASLRRRRGVAVAA